MSGEELRFEILVSEDVPVIVPGCISFETGATAEQVADPTHVVYEHHGVGFSKGALTAFYEDLIFARPLPLRFATRRVNDVDTALAIALFLHRSIAISPNTTSFVAAVDLIHRWGLPAFAHISEEHGRLIRFLRRHLLLDQPNILYPREQGNRLMDVIGWVRDYLEYDRLPTIPEQQVDVRVVDHGTNGFVVATCDTDDLTEGWVRLYRQGFLRGVLMGPSHDGRRNVLVARKTDAVELDLTTGAKLLDELSIAHGEIPGWQVTENLLASPQGGTIISLTEMLEILLRL